MMNCEEIYDKTQAGEERMKSIRAAEAQRGYMRAWRAKNKDKTREYNKRYWEKRAAKKMEG